MTEYRRRDDFATSEVIRPAAVLNEISAREVLVGLSGDDVRAGGHWLISPGVWCRFDQPWPEGSHEPGPAVQVGTVRSIYDSPQRYAVTIFRASITSEGIDRGWTVESLCDDALRHAGLNLSGCPRAELAAPPRPLRFA